VSAQNVKVEWGTEYNVKGLGKTKLLAIENDGYYVVFGLNNPKVNVRILKLHQFTHFMIKRRKN